MFSIKMAYFLLIPIIILCSCGKDDPINAPEVPTTEEPELEGYEYPEGNIYFSSPPIDIAGVAFYEPMGGMGVFPQDHGGFVHFEYGVEAPTTPIFAMADGAVIEVGKGGDDYFMTVKYSTTISAKLGHVGRFAQFITDQTGTIEEGHPKVIEIEVKAGQIIGFISSFSALDIGIHDLAVAESKSFCYPELAYFENLYAADIFEYYRNGSVRNELLSRNVRTSEPYGGKNDYDVKGTISGNWYLKTPITDKDLHINHLAIGYDHIYAHRMAIFDGLPRFDPDITDTYSYSWIKNNGPKPEEIDVQFGSVKYELIPNKHLKRNPNGTYEIISLDDVDQQSSRGVMMIQMMDAETMQLEFFSGKEPEEINGFSDQARIYVRKPDYQ